MTKLKTIEGNHTGVMANYVLVVSRFNSYIVDSLEAGAVDALKKHGVSDANITVIRVPGALEIPLAVKTTAASDTFDAVIALGAVIRGSTYHFEIVSNESARCLSDLALSLGIPVINGVLTVDTIEQAIERAGTKAGNKGADAAVAAMEMVSLMRKLGTPG
jgi:6,7-dimethyl-8-ribityllumazine synthase